MRDQFPAVNECECAAADNLLQTLAIFVKLRLFLGSDITVDGRNAKESFSPIQLRRPCQIFFRILQYKIMIGKTEIVVCTVCNDHCIRIKRHFCQAFRKEIGSPDPADHALSIKMTGYNIGI